VQVSGLTSGIKALEAGHAHTCAVSKTGAAWCWGYGFFGRLGEGTISSSRIVPVNPTGLGVGAGVVMISAGDEHTCAVIGGGVSCWGQNTSGQLGNGTTSVSLVPAAVFGLSSIY
jgi:alpha-tubulin suppressor-like RCC1 family protein